MKAEMVKEGNAFMLSVKGEKILPAAYMSYLEDNADYEGFTKAGYNLFCACVYMGDGPINETSGVHTFGRHVWKARRHYDFTPIYESVEKIVKANENARVMLRVNLNVPLWWRKENPEELVVLSDGKREPYMQSEYSELWREDVEKFLAYLCAYVRGFPFSKHIVAIQLAGMQTEEWLALRTAEGCFDYSAPAQRAYKKWLLNRYQNEVNAYLPTLEELNEARHGAKITDVDKHRKLIDYMRFFNEGRAQVIKELCALVKEETKGELLVGVFYGYFGQLPCEYGHNALSMLLQDENIDFFASPFAYIGCRQTAEDWIYQSVMDSTTLAGKAWFLEADVRTCYTKALYETNPELMDGERTVKHFQNPVWFGPKREEESVWVMLRSFAKVLCSGHAFWWFDMWGQWYNSPNLMELVRRCRELYERGFGERKNSELAVILDEESSYGVSEEYYYALSKEQLVELGFVGAPYDMYSIQDAERIKSQYKTLLYIAPTKGDFRGNVLVVNGEKVKKEGVFTAGKIRSILQKAGGHVFSKGNIVYANDRFVCVTAAKEGKVKLTMPKRCKIQAFTDGKIYEGKEFSFPFAYNQTELFEVIE